MPQSKKELKRLYDIEYRRKNWDRLKAKQQEYNRSPDGRAMQKRNREKFKESHLQYCRTPEYRAWKKEYDEINLAKVKYGEFWEIMIIVKKIHKEVCRIVPDRYDRQKMRGQDRIIKARTALKRHLLYGWSFNY